MELRNNCNEFNQFQLPGNSRKTNATSWNRIQLFNKYKSMKKIILTSILALSTGLALAQEGFDNILVDSGKVLNGRLGETEYIFQSDNFNMTLPVVWDTSWGGLWTSGWAISTKWDSTQQASNFNKHLYCAKPFKGFNQSKAFAVGQNGSFLYRDRASAGIASFYISNSTYAYNSMKFGDAFGKKFGGNNGTDSDYFFTRIHSYSKGILSDSQDVYLADFRDADSTKDYILNTWKKVMLPISTDSVIFAMYSSDNSSWGMNTPGFFAIDEIEYGKSTAIEISTVNSVNIYPNPASNIIKIKSETALLNASIYNMLGEKVLGQTLNGLKDSELKVSALQPGSYIILMTTNFGITTGQIVIVK
jgi:hypothetical protein